MRLCGTLRATLDDGPVALHVEGDVDGSALRVADEERGVTLFRLGELVMEGLRLEENGALEIARMVFEDLQAMDRGGEEQRLMQGRYTEILALSYHDNRLDVGITHSDEVTSTVYITPEGDLESRGVLTTSLQALRESSEATEDSPPLRWR